MTETHTDNNTDMDTAQVPSGGGMSVREICEANGLKIDSVRKRWNDRREENPQMFPPFSKDIVPTPEQMAAIPTFSGVKGVAVKKAGVKRTAVGHTVPVAKQVEKAAATPAPIKRTSNVGAYIILSGVALVSWMNIYSVTGSLFRESAFCSLVLTGLLCGAPFVFAWFDMIKGSVKGLVIALGVFEWGCNLTRIYGGLTNFDTPRSMGTPTRFLGLVTDICNTGTHLTALGLAVVMAGILSWLYFTSIFGIKAK